MSASSLTPTRIEPRTSRDLLLVWNTGEQYSIPYFEIRFQCPCAVCVDEKTGQRVLHRDDLPEDVRPTSVQLIGRYAVQFTWTDNHATGMYHYDRLHDLCTRFGKRI